MAIDVFNRYEYKFMLDRVTFEKVVKILDEHMETDSHNKEGTPYTISNIYFDTADDYLIRTSLSKPIYKEKLRLRTYGIPDINSVAFLEIKKKFNGVVNKRRTKIALSDAYDFLKSGEMPEMNDYMNAQVLREIQYLLKIYNLSPKVYLAYDRIAYFEKDNKDLRISFDMNIRSRRYDLELEKGDYGEKLLPDDVYVMEIKTSLAMPLWLTQILTEYGIKKIRFSKYGTDYKNMLKSYDFDETEYEEVV